MADADKSLHAADVYYSCVDSVTDLAPIATQGHKLYKPVTCKVKTLQDRQADAKTEDRVRWTDVDRLQQFFDAPLPQLLWSVPQYGPGKVYAAGAPRPDGFSADDEEGLESRFTMNLEGLNAFPYGVGTKQCLVLGVLEHMRPSHPLDEAAATAAAAAADDDGLNGDSPVAQLFADCPLKRHQLVVVLCRDKRVPDIQERVYISLMERLVEAYQNFLGHHTSENPTDRHFREIRVLGRELVRQILGETAFSNAVPSRSEPALLADIDAAVANMRKKPIRPSTAPPLARAEIKKLAEARRTSHVCPARVRLLHRLPKAGQVVTDDTIDAILKEQDQAQIRDRVVVSLLEGTPFACADTGLLFMALRTGDLCYKQSAPKRKQRAPRNLRAPITVEMGKGHIARYRRAPNPNPDLCTDSGLLDLYPRVDEPKRGGHSTPIISRTCRDELARIGGEASVKCGIIVFSKFYEKEPWMDPERPTISRRLVDIAINRSDFAQIKSDPDRTYLRLQPSRSTPFPYMTVPTPPPTALPTPPPTARAVDRRPNNKRRAPAPPAALAPLVNRRPSKRLRPSPAIVSLPLHLEACIARIREADPKQADAFALSLGYLHLATAALTHEAFQLGAPSSVSLPPPAVVAEPTLQEAIQEGGSEPCDDEPSQNEDDESAILPNTDDEEFVVPDGHESSDSSEDDDQSESEYRESSADDDEEQEDDVMSDESDPSQSDHLDDVGTDVPDEYELSAPSTHPFGPVESIRDEDRDDGSEISSDDNEEPGNDDLPPPKATTGADDAGDGGDDEVQIITDSQPTVEGLLTLPMPVGPIDPLESPLPLSQDERGRDDMSDSDTDMGMGLYGDA